MMLAAAPDPVGDFLKANWWVFPVFFVALWWLVNNLIGRVSGWARLAEVYRATAPFQGTKWFFQSAQMRYLSHYNGCLTFGANEQGMYAAGWGPFRAGAAPLLVPWGDLEIRPEKRWLIAGYGLRFRQAPDVPMWVRQSLGDKIVQASQGSGGGIRAAPPIG